MESCTEIEFVVAKLRSLLLIYLFVFTDLLLAARTALTAHTGSLVSPTRKVISHSSGIEARNRMS